MYKFTIYFEGFDESSDILVDNLEYAHFIKELIELENGSCSNIVHKKDNGSLYILFCESHNYKFAVNFNFNSSKESKEHINNVFKQYLNVEYVKIRYKNNCFYVLIDGNDKELKFNVLDIFHNVY